MLGRLAPRLSAVDWLALLCLGTAATWFLVSGAGWTLTPDGEIHLHRTRALAEALRQGVFYPRWFPDFAFGYGHPILHYYAPAAYYPPALLHLAGLDVAAAMHLSVALSFAASGLLLYRLLRELVSPPPALVGAWLFQFWPYRLYDLDVRGAVPEFAAFLWPPLILVAAWVLLRRARPTPVAAWALAVAWAMLALTHHLTAFMAALVTLLLLPLVAALCTLTPGGYFTRLRFLARRLTLPTLVGLLLSSFYVVPVLAENGWVMLGASAPAYGYTAHFAGWEDLLQWAWPYAYPQAADPTVPLPVYLLPLLLWGLVLVWRMPQRRPLLLLMVASLVPIWFSTAASAPVWEAFAHIFGKLQFPWRWQALLVLPTALLLALLLERFLTGRAGWLRSTIAAALVLALTVYAAAGLSAPAPRPTITPQTLWAFDATHGQIGATWTGEFLPRWVTAPRWQIGRDADPAPPVTAVVPFSATATRVGYLAHDFTVRADHAFTLTLDTFYFPAWQITVNGAPVPTAPIGELGLLSATLPAGESNVRVAWADTPAVRLGWGLSALGWLMGLGWLLAARARRLQVAWLLVGALGLLSAGSWTSVHATPAPTRADYGPVQLTGVLTPSARPGQDAAITLIWAAATAPPPWTVFVHLLGPDSTVVAQWDEAIGGPYRPRSRIAPGSLLRHTIFVPLPADLPPGDYPIGVGVYPAGQPESPLIAANQSGPRLVVGTLTVR